MDLGEVVEPFRKRNSHQSCARQALVVESEPVAVNADQIGPFGQPLATQPAGQQEGVGVKSLPDLGHQFAFHRSQGVGFGARHVFHPQPPFRAGLIQQTDPGWDQANPGEVEGLDLNGEVRVPFEEPLLELDLLQSRHRFEITLNHQPLRDRHSSPQVQSSPLHMSGQVGQDRHRRARSIIDDGHRGDRGATIHVDGRQMAFGRHCHQGSSLLGPGRFPGRGCTHHYTESVAHPATLSTLQP